MSVLLNEKLNRACIEAIMVDYLHVEYINISPEALNELMQMRGLHMDHGIIDAVTGKLKPITWHGIELRENVELSGVTFNLVTSPVETPAWGGSPKGRLPG